MVYLPKVVQIDEAKKWKHLKETRSKKKVLPEIERRRIDHGMIVMVWWPMPWLEEEGAGGSPLKWDGERAEAVTLRLGCASKATAQHGRTIP